MRTKILSILFLASVLFACNSNEEKKSDTPEETINQDTVVVSDRPLTEEEIKLREEEIQRLNAVEDAKTSKRSKLDMLNMKMDRLMTKYHKPEYEPKRQEIEEYIQSLHMKANDIRTSLENIQAKTVEEFNEKTLDFEKRLEKLEAELDKPREF